MTLVRGKGDVDGVYRLLEEATEKRDEVCVDGCVYSKVSFNDVCIFFCSPK